MGISTFNLFLTLNETEKTKTKTKQKNKINNISVRFTHLISINQRIDFSSATKNNDLKKKNIDVNP